MPGENLFETKKFFSSNSLIFWLAEWSLEFFHFKVIAFFLETTLPPINVLLKYGNLCQGLESTSRMRCWQIVFNRMA